jgi:hypothetical protein
MSKVPQANGLAVFTRMGPALFPVYIEESTGQSPVVYWREPTHGGFCWRRVRDDEPCQIYPGVPAGYVSGVGGFNVMS